MRKLIKAELSKGRGFTGPLYIELWKTPTGYSVYIAKTADHVQRLGAAEAEALYKTLLEML